MVDFSLATDEFGLLKCTLASGQTTGTAYASNVAEALADLLGAVDNAGTKGVGECFWPRSAGAYRWLLRRDQDSARLAVLWSTGTMTGWESVFWIECEWAPLAQTIRDRVGQYLETAGLTPDN